MSTIVNVPKNGSVANVNSTSNVPAWSNWIDDLFNNDLPSVFNTNFNTDITLPKVNIKETPDAFVVDIAVPGFNKSDFHLDLDNHVLTISTEDRKENEHKEENFTRKEFNYSSFKRTFSLPESVDEDKIEAGYTSGILSILLPKREEAKQKPARTIKIS